jgi:hypothetical protein
MGSRVVLYVVEWRWHHIARNTQLVSSNGAKQLQGRFPWIHLRGYEEEANVSLCVCGTSEISQYLQQFKRINAEICGAAKILIALISK